MKKTIHRADSRGYANHGWLKSYHSFSFANHYNPERMRFGLLRVLNDDTIAPGMGFGTHPHENMEIISIPLEGGLAHKDSTGGEGVIMPGEVQIMSAGTGVTHSEYNYSKTKDGKFLQLWVFPKEKNITPRYDQKAFTGADKKNKFLTVVSPDKNNSTLWINQNCWISLSDIDKGKKLQYEVNLKVNGVYLFVMEGKINVADETLEARDAIGIEDAEAFTVEALENTSLLAIEVPMRQ